MQAVALYIEEAIKNWGAMGVFVGSILEEIIVPIPSALVQSGAGFLFLSGEPATIANIIKLVTWIGIPSALGVAIGSLPIYFLTYYGGMPAIRKFGKYFFLNADKIEKARTDIVAKPHTVTVITALRFIPLLPNAFITATAGLLRIPFSKFLISTVIGVFIRALYLGAIGWITGSATGAEDRPAHEKAFILLGVLAVISVLTTLFIKYKSRKK